MCLKSKWAGYICVLSTAPDISEAERIADTLVSEKLVACVNLVSGVKSIYWWKNRVQHEEEIMMVMKTRRKYLHRLENRIKELHSYEVPEIIALNIFRGSKEYLNWIYSSVNP